MTKFHSPKFSNHAKSLFNEDHHSTTEVRFFEWLETPMNYETTKRRRKREAREATIEAKEIPQATGLVARIIMGSILLISIVGLYALELF